MSYADAGVYYKNNFYIFGGGGAALDGPIVQFELVDRFAIIKLP